MVKDSISQNSVAETVGSISVASGKIGAFLKRGAEIGLAKAKIAAEFIENFTTKNQDLTAVSIGVSLLCFGMFGLWVAILMRTGI